MLNIDAGTELDIEFDTGVINYSQTDSHKDSTVNVSFYVRKYSYTELTVYFFSEINIDANKQLLISVELTLGWYVPVCNVSLLRTPHRRFRVRRFAQRITMC